MKRFFEKIFFIFSPFRTKQYLYLWCGAFLSNIGSWVQTVALNWYLVIKLNSAFYLGVLNFVSSLPVVFLTHIAGVIADRVDRKKIIITTHLLLCFAAISLGLIIQFIHNNTIVWIFVITLLFGLGNTFTSPAWQSIIPQLVDKNLLLSAIALNSAQFNLARFVGPVVATFIVSKLGLVWCFYFNGVSFLFVVISLLLIKLTPQYNLSKNSNNLYYDIIDAWKYIKGKKYLIKYILLAGIISFFGMGYVVLVPIYAKNILVGNIKTLGTLMSASGLGALTGALLVSLINLYIPKIKIIKYGMILYGIFLSIFAFSKNLILSSISLYFAAFLYLNMISSINTSIQESIDEQYRGRVMSNFVWMFMGTMPFGTIVCGSLADLISPQITLLFFSTAMVLSSLFLIET